MRTPSQNIVVINSCSKDPEGQHKRHPNANNGDKSRPLVVVVQERPDNEGNQYKGKQRKYKDRPSKAFSHSYNFLKISSATWWRPLGKYTINVDCSDQSSTSPSGRIRHGKPSDSKVSFHISAIIAVGTRLNSTHMKSQLSGHRLMTLISLTSIVSRLLYMLITIANPNATSAAATVTTNTAKI